MKTKITKDELINGLTRIAEEVKSDPEAAKKAEEMNRKLQRKGTPAGDDFIGEEK